MANTIRIKRSATAGKVPTTAQLALGELAVNTNDGKLYTKKDDGTEAVVEIGGGAPAVAGGAIITNTQSISSDYTLTGVNGMSAGPIEIASGTTVTVASGANWVIV